MALNQSRRIAWTACLLGILPLAACNSSGTPPAQGSSQVSQAAPQAVPADPAAPNPAPAPAPAPVVVAHPEPAPRPTAVPSPLPGMETPADYTLDQLVARAKQSNFDSQLAFEHFVEARLSAQNAVLNLLPHFSTNTVLNVASVNWLNIGKSVGDLVPFLLPNHWFHAAGAKFQSQAEYDGWVLMRADAVSIVEGLALATARDLEAIEVLEADEQHIEPIRQQIIQSEQAGLLPVGASDDIASVLNTIDKAISLLTEDVSEERAALAHAVGFQNPDAIHSVSGLPNGSVDAHLLPSGDELGPKVLDASVELKQMDALIQVAKWNRRASFFNWLDPSGDSSGGIGFGLGDYLAVSRAQQQEVQVKREQVRSLLMEKATVALDQGGQTIQAYALASDGSDIQARRITRLTQELGSGINFALSDLVDALEKQSSSEIETLSARYAFYTIQSKIERLTFTGPYADLPGSH